MDASGFEQLNAQSVLPKMEEDAGAPVDAAIPEDLAALLAQIDKQ